MIYAYIRERDPNIAYIGLGDSNFSVIPCPPILLCHCHVLLTRRRQHDSR